MPSHRTTVSLLTQPKTLRTVGTMEWREKQARKCVERFIAANRGALPTSLSEIAAIADQYDCRFGTYWDEEDEGGALLENRGEFLILVNLYPTASEALARGFHELAHLLLLRDCADPFHYQSERDEYEVVARMTENVCRAMLETGDTSKSRRPCR